jgi:ABC-2 type transport system permease protein
VRTRSVAFAVAWRVLHNVLTNPAIAIPTLMFPLFFFTAFAGGLSRLDNLPGFDYAPGYTAFQFVFVLLQSAAFGGVFTGFGIARDFESGFGGIDLVGLYTLALLLNVAGILWASGVAMRLRTMQAGPIMQFPVFIALFLAPVYVPLDLLHGWVHGVARFNPLTRLVEAARSLLAGDPTEVAAAFLIGAALIALFALWAVRGLRHAEAAG